MLKTTAQGGGSVGVPVLTRNDSPSGGVGVSYGSYDSTNLAGTYTNTNTNTNTKNNLAGAGFRPSTECASGCQILPKPVFSHRFSTLENCRAWCQQSPECAGCLQNETSVIATAIGQPLISGTGKDSYTQYLKKDPAPQSADTGESVQCQREVENFVGNPALQADNSLKQYLSYWPNALATCKEDATSGGASSESCPPGVRTAIQTACEINTAQLLNGSLAPQMPGLKNMDVCGIWNGATWGAVPDTCTENAFLKDARGLWYCQSGSKPQLIKPRPFTGEDLSKGEGERSVATTSQDIASDFVTPISQKYANTVLGICSRFGNATPVNFAPEGGTLRSNTILQERALYDFRAVEPSRAVLALLLEKGGAGGSGSGGESGSNTNGVCAGAPDSREACDAFCTKRAGFDMSVWHGNSCACAYHHDAICKKYPTREVKDYGILKQLPQSCLYPTCNPAQVPSTACSVSTHGCCPHSSTISRNDASGSNCFLDSLLENIDQKFDRVEDSLRVLQAETRDLQKGERTLEKMLGEAGGAGGAGEAGGAGRSGEKGGPCQSCCYKSKFSQGKTQYSSWCYTGSSGEWKGFSNENCH